jgi:hypothetical protein
VKISPPGKSVKVSDTCLWLEESREYQPRILPALVVEVNGDALRLIVFTRDGSLFVKSGVLPFGDLRLRAFDGTTSAVGKNNGCWFVEEDTESEVQELRKEITALKTRITKLQK